MGATIEQWMRDAAAAIMQLVRDYEIDGRRIGYPAKNGLAPITEIIASHAPSEAAPQPTCPTCGSNDKEFYRDPCNDLYWHGSADKFHTYLCKPIKPRKAEVDSPPEIEHNDH